MAFDTVDHSILLQRLHNIESRHIGGISLDWLANYLRCRTQSFRLEGIAAHTCPVPHGVPQGSFLEPLLFILYTSDISRIGHERGFRRRCYADSISA